MLDVADAEVWGRKVLFLYPHSVIQDELVRELFRHEYEVYLLGDHETAPLALTRYPGSIMFINLDQGMPEPAWEALIRELIADQAGAARLGVVSQHADRELAEKYLMELGLPCGFITLKQGPKEALKTLLTVLEANEARGKRRYVRALCGKADMATFNLKVYGRVYTGAIDDISSAGMACTFEQVVDLSQGKEMDDMQLRLRGTLCKVRVRHLGSKAGEGDRTSNVFTFDHSVDSSGRGKIQEFVYGTLQREMNRQLEQSALGAEDAASAPVA
jgi:hypothetical protein